MKIQDKLVIETKDLGKSYGKLAGRATSRFHTSLADRQLTHALRSLASYRIQSVATDSSGSELGYSWTIRPAFPHGFARSSKDILHGGPGKMKSSALKVEPKRKDQKVE